MLDAQCESSFMLCLRYTTHFICDGLNNILTNQRLAFITARDAVRVRGVTIRGSRHRSVACVARLVINPAISAPVVARAYQNLQSVYVAPSAVESAK